MHRPNRCYLAMILATAAVLEMLPVAAVAEEETLIAGLLEGKPTVHLRYRYEQVDDDLVPRRTGEASTLRAALGWQSGAWRGFSLFGEMEHVAEVGIDRYKEGPGPVDPGSARFPVIADPPGTELNQAYAQMVGPAGLRARIGRQDLTYRAAPLHRHIGNVLWRQNWQTYDAVSVAAAPLKDLAMNYAYVTQVNRIFGSDAPDPFDEFDCDCHLINLHYSALAHVRLEAFAYLLDIDNAPAFALDTYGVRATGTYPLSARWKLVYAGEYAIQDEAGGNPLPVDAEYYLGELGINVTLPFRAVPAVTVKGDYEVLGGNGVSAFQTPLATGHAFQGWADRFLVTPPDGIRDWYVTAIAPILGGQLFVSYHRLRSDELDYAYGEELDVQYERNLAKYWTLGAKAAFYHADRNAQALRRAGAAPTHDATKFWLWLQFDY